MNCWDQCAFEVQCDHARLASITARFVRQAWISDYGASPKVVDASGRLVTHRRWFIRALRRRGCDEALRMAPTADGMAEGPAGKRASLETWAEWRAGCGGNGTASGKPAGRGARTPSP